MKPFKSTIIVFDTEFIMYIPNKLDLLEIGAVALDNERNILDTFFIKCKPLRYAYNKKVQNHLARISYNTDESYYYSGVSYGSGLEKFFTWSLKYKHPIYCSWSNYDHKVFNDKLNTIKKKDTMFKHDKINMFDIQRSYMNLFSLKQNPSLSSVLEKHNILPSDSTQLHNALNDSLYTSEIMSIYFDHFIQEIRTKSVNAYRTIKIIK